MKSPQVKKIYSDDQNVYEAAISRLEYMFTHFDHVSFSFSGGKDSSVMLQLAHDVAKRMNVKYSVLYVDLEAMMTHTIKHVEEVREKIKSTCDRFYWVCLPMIEENSTSSLNPEFLTWDENVKSKWVRAMPEDSINIHNNIFDFWEEAMSIEEFSKKFSIWINKKKGKGGPTAEAVGIRTDESLHRFGAITSYGKEGFNGMIWTTPLANKVYNAYPIYDWKVQDIWAAVAKLDLLYNEAYELMYKMGTPVTKQRICQPFGSAQKQGLHQIAEIDPSSWNKMVERVEGVNFGAIYQRTTLLGSISSYKPAHMTWQQYAVYLLESIGLYEPKIMERYYQKIKYYLKFAEVHSNHPYGSIPEEAPGNAECWKRIARALEPNDFYLQPLDYGFDKAGDRLLIELRKKHKLTGEGYATPLLKRSIQKLEVETTNESN